MGDEVNIPMTAFAFVVVSVGLIYFCAAFEGAFLTPVSVLKRILYFAAALLLVWPDNRISVVGICVVCALFTVDYIQHRKMKKSAVGPALPL
jgi:TRAP-type uncharacterized transport system fused permease subunit